MQYSIQFMLHLLNDLVLFVLRPPPPPHACLPDIDIFLYFSFFQHYNLYSYMFTHTQAEEIIGTDVSILNLFYFHFFNLIRDFFCVCSQGPKLGPIPNEKFSDFFPNKKKNPDFQKKNFGGED